VQAGQEWHTKSGRQTEAAPDVHHGVARDTIPTVRVAADGEQLTNSSSEIAAPRHCQRTVRRGPRPRIRYVPSAPNHDPTGPPRGCCDRASSMVSLKCWNTSLLTGRCSRRRTGRVTEWSVESCSVMVVEWRKMRKLLYESRGLRFARRVASISSRSRSRPPGTWPPSPPATASHRRIDLPDCSDKQKPSRVCRSGPEGYPRVRTHTPRRAAPKTAKFKQIKAALSNGIRARRVNDLEDEPSVWELVQAHEGRLEHRNALAKRRF